MASEVRGALWRAEYGEISERFQFRFGYIGVGSDSWTATFVIGWLADLISTLTAADGTPVGTLTRGTYFQARRVTRYLDIEPRLDSGWPSPYFRLAEVDRADLIATLGLVQTGVGNGSLKDDDWDTSSLPTQVFDTDNGFGIANLRLRFVDGFFGQRLHLTGTEEGVMPYLEVVPTTQTGTDVGGAIAGLQVYRTIGGGGVPNREFLAIEASGDLATLPGFKIATWASGTGTIRPLRIVIGTAQAMVFQDDSNILVGPTKRLFFEDIQLMTPIIESRSAAGQLQAIQARQYGTVVEDAPALVLARNRGTIEAPGYPVSGDMLGEMIVGSMDPAAPSTFRSGGGLRVEALQNWGAGARGSIASIRVVPNNSGSTVEAAAFADTIVDGETGFLVRVNRAGVYTRNRVSIGAADSGGAGFRVLRVAN